MATTVWGSSTRSSSSRTISRSPYLVQSSRGKSPSPSPVASLAPVASLSPVVSLSFPVTQTPMSPSHVLSPSISEPPSAKASPSSGDSIFKELSSIAAEGTQPRTYSTYTVNYDQLKVLEALVDGSDLRKVARQVLFVFVVYPNSLFQ